MRTLRRLAGLGLILVLALFSLAPVAGAQPSGTPTAATPAAANPLFARLGGTLGTFESAYGPPSFNGDGLVRYDDVTLNGIPTILVVYYDSAETVTRLALVYSIQPAALSDSVGILPTAATVAPEDGVCDASAVSSGFGNEVYPCHSAALAGVFSTGQLTALGVTQGVPGDYSIAVNPLPDAYFELILQAGTDGASLAPTPIPGEPSPSPTPTLQEQYPPLTDASDLMDGKIALDAPLSFTGEVLTLQVAEFGKQFHLGQDESLGVTSLFQVRVPGHGAQNDQVIFVGYNGDASGLAIGDQVTVYGANYGTQCFENAMKDEICQPLIAADLVQKQ